MCETYRIPHSHYLGGPLEWTAVDRAKAEAYAAWKAECCDGCGTHPHWWDPEHGGSRTALVADVRRCLGCQEKEALREQLPKHERGLHVFLTPNVEEAHDGR